MSFGVEENESLAHFEVFRIIDNHLADDHDTTKHQQHEEGQSEPVSLKKAHGECFYMGRRAWAIIFNFDNSQNSSALELLEPRVRIDYKETLGLCFCNDLDGFMENDNWGSPRGDSLLLG